MAGAQRFIIEEQETVIKPGQEKVFIFDTKQMEGADLADSRVRLRLRGDVCLHPSMMYEGGLPYLYRDIDDCLSGETHHSRYSLKICADGEDWPRRAYYKITCPPAINTQYRVQDVTGEWDFSCYAKTEGLTLLEKGCARFTFERFLKKPGRDVRDISGEADEVTVLDLPLGTNDWEKVGCRILLDENTASILVTVSVEHAKGTVWLEEPDLISPQGNPILPPFEQADRFHECFNWFGENLSEKEWTALLITVNKTTLPACKIFQRCFAGSENEIGLPDGLLRDGENEIRIRNCSDYHGALPYKVVRAELLAEKKLPVRLVWCPETVPAGEEFGVLLKTYEKNMRAAVSVSGVAKICGMWEEDGAAGRTAVLGAPGSRKEAGQEAEELQTEEILLEEAGLHILRLKAEKTGNFRLTVSERQKSCTKTAEWRSIERENDGVYAGSGDSIYVPQETDKMEDFLVWYLENDLGSLITFRPVYRWSGTRECNEKLWKRMTFLCNGLNLAYCHIIDGRELPGLNANPPARLLEGKGFLGNQAHERDGALYYWLQRKGHISDIFFEELSHRILHYEDAPDYHFPIGYDGENTYLCFSPTAPEDMEQAAGQFVEKAKKALRGVKRHSGPSTLFKYFYQAGIETCSAELMYGPLEVILAALRGAGIAYGRETFGAHLAVQWGTTPHDTKERYRRYRLALFVSYLQGVSHINTEEGLYRMEELFAVLDRFSGACLCHGEVEREFVRFVRSHTRRGKW